MSNKNFIVQNGITVGTTHIFASNGAIVTTGTTPTQMGTDLNIINGNITVSPDNTATSFVTTGGLSDAILVGSKNVNSFVQVAAHNPNGGGNSSTDFIAYADTGDNTQGFVDIGIAGSGFNDPAYAVTKAGDSYIFASAPTGTGGNLVLATEGGTYGDIVFAAGGFSDGEIQGRFIYQDGLYVTGNLISDFGSVYQGPDTRLLANDDTYSTTLNGAVNNSVTTITVASTAGFRSSGVVLIGSEQIRYTSKNSTQFLTCTRGFGGTTAASHLNGVAVTQDYVGLTDASGIYAGDANAFVQFALKNKNTGASASTDVIAYASNGDNDSGWMDMGITSETFADTTYGVTGPDDGYLFMSAPVGSSGNGSVFISTSNNGQHNDIVFSTNGFTAGTERMRIVGVSRAGKPAGVDVNIATTSTSTTTGALRVNGGIGLQGNLYVGGNVSIVGNISFGGAGTTVSSQSLTVENPISFLGNSNPGNSYDTGVVGIYKNGGTTTTYTGLVKQASTGYWRVFDNLTTQPTTTVSWAGTTPAGMYVGNITIANTTTSTSSTTGALVVNGGVGIQGTVYATHINPSANVTYDLGSSSAWWRTLYGVSTQAKYADLAENYQADSNYQYGTVLMFGGAQEVTIASADTTAVAGVVSQNPAHLMNGALAGPNVIPLALTGRVPCNVIGPIKKGDLLVSAGFGFAKANNDAKVGQVIGKALADFPSGVKGQIEVVVGRF